MPRRKQKILRLLIIALTIILSLALLPTSVFASSIKIYVDGKEFAGSNQAKIINERTYIPVRSYTDLLGFNAEWDAKERSVTISNVEHVTKFYQNSRRVIQDGVTLYMENRTIIEDGTTYLPVRTVAELYGKTIDWDGVDNQVNIRDYKTYTVGEWETLSGISRELGILEAALRVWNNLPEGEPEMGTVLYLESTDKVTLDYTNTETIIPYTVADLEMLAKIIYAEAVNHPYEGKVAVGAVILNRVESPNWPNTLRDVIYQRGQFTPITNGQYNRAKPTDSYYQAAEDALRGIDPVDGAIFFNNPARSKIGVFKRPIVTIIGNHYYYR
jgi:hypothetical protein